MPITPYITRLSDGKKVYVVWMRLFNPSTLQPVIQPIDRPNVEGWAFRQLASKGRPFRVRAMRDFPTVQNARAAVQHIRDGLIGGLCSFTTSDKTTYGRMMCLDVVELDVRPALQCVGGLVGREEEGEITLTLSEPVATRGLAFFEFEVVNVGPAAPAPEEEP